MRSAIVLGADGFVGRMVVKRLTHDRWRVHPLGKAAGDLSMPGVVDAAFAAAPKVDLIFHLVTRQRTGSVQYGIQGELLRINAAIHLNVLEAWRTRQPQAKLISTGSSCAYPEHPSPLTEDMFGAGVPHPSVRGYAMAKQVLAVGAQTYAEQYGLRHLHCILATLYGPHDHKEADRSHFVGAMLHRAAADKLAGRNAFPVWGDPGAVREVLHVDDQIDAILAAERAFENRIVNCTAGSPITVGEVAGEVVRALDWNVTLEEAPGSFAGAGFKLLDSSAFLMATGWRPRIELKDGLRRLAQAEYAGAF